MNFCPHCGARLRPDHLFCASCGQRVVQSSPSTSIAGQGSPRPWSAVPGVPPVAPSATPPRRPVDLTGLLRGNWVAALVVALVALVLAFGSSAALIWMGDPDHTSTHDRLVFSAIATASTVSADAVGSIDGDYVAYEGAGQEDFSLAAAGGFVPFTVALLSLGVAGWLFRRFTRGYPQVKHAIGDALRAALVYALLMMAVVIALRGDEDSRVYKSDGGFGDESETASFGASIPTTFFLALLVMFSVLALACVMRRDWLGARMLKVHAFVAAPISGIATFLLMLPVAGVVANLAFWLTVKDDHGADDELDFLQTAAIIIGSLGNIGVGFLGAGSGGPIGNSWDAREFDSDRGAEWHRLSWAVDETDAWGLWFAIPTLFVVLAVAAYVVIRRARASGHAFANVMIWAGSMFVAYPVIARLASAHGAVDGDDATSELSAEGYFGLKPADTLLLPLIAVLVALVLAAVTGALDVRRIAASMQQSPGTTPHPDRVPPVTPGSWTHPSGMNPSGANPSGMNPSGANPSGADHSGVDRSGVDQPARWPDHEPPTQPGHVHRP
ncbi:zinc-ribbon domain-containing protein [Nocardioides sp. JQ2195]|uniref:zinc-ribbon domain-containing protein n=1 Tax=Nocardioides sp. JQ2195 TaxID=2592334 RepID=UPI00197DF57A|nr:zinc-ribbon domain-containing protein [Nocardioides sp. JQ2195]